VVVNSSVGVWLAQGKGCILCAFPQLSAIISLRARNWQPAIDSPDFVCPSRLMRGAVTGSLEVPRSLQLLGVSLEPGSRLSTIDGQASSACQP
jgi:hypothetical protein